MIEAPWRAASLGDVLTLQRGFDLPTKQRRPGSVPVVSSSGVSGAHDQAAVKAPGIVTGRYGTIGSVFFLSEDFWPLNTTLYVSDFKGNDPLFLSYLLRTIDFQTHSGKSGVPGVNRNDLHGLTVVAPELGEQRAIAAALSDIDSLIAALNALIAKKRAIKQAVMQQLLTGETRLPGFAREWITKPLGQIVNIRSEKILPKSVSPNTLCVELEHIGQGSGRLVGQSDASQVDSSKHRFSTGDVLFGRLRSYLRKYWHADGDGLCSTEIWPLVANPREVDAGFLFQLVQTESFIDAASVSYGTHMPRADWTVLRSFEVLMPETVAEQQAIAQVLSDIDAEIEALEARVVKTRDIKQGMMQQLLTGRVRLPVPTTAPEDSPP